jgi:Tfp pilus assembly protein PilF
MPRLSSADIAHTMVTDHRIVRTPRERASATSSAGRLVEFGPPRGRARELGLAYGEVALRGDAFAAREARRVLEGVLARHERDPDVLTRLGHLYQVQGDMARAERLYQRALQQDPGRAEVAANVGVFYARRGQLRDALELWRAAFANNPHLTGLGLNLANGLCAAGDAEGSRRVVRRVLEHDPDSPAARQLLAALADANCPTP